MNERGKWIAVGMGIGVVACCVAIGGTLVATRAVMARAVPPGYVPYGGEAGRMAVAHALPQMDGSHLEVKLAEVTYEPGGSSGPHSHPCPVVAYVAEGEIRSQVDAGPETTFKVGEGFYEPPNGAHRISANGSKTVPAKLLAFFICDRATPLSVAIPEKK